MRELVPIGRFSELTGLTVKALRRYHERDVLRPAVVDFESGRRYYSPEQVDAAERIRLLRSVEMPLEEIRALLSADGPEQAVARLAAHRRRIEGHIAELRGALSRLRALEEQYERDREEHLMDQEQEAKAYRCSFCGKEHGEVERLIAGPNGVFICDECVDKCNEILARERATA